MEGWRESVNKAGLQVELSRVEGLREEESSRGGTRGGSRETGRQHVLLARMK